MAILIHLFELNRHFRHKRNPQTLTSLLIEICNQTIGTMISLVLQMSQLRSKDVKSVNQGQTDGRGKKMSGYNTSAHVLNHQTKLEVLSFIIDVAQTEVKGVKKSKLVNFRMRKKQKDPIYLIGATFKEQSDENKMDRKRWLIQLRESQRTFHPASGSMYVPHQNQHIKPKPGQTIIVLEHLLFTLKLLLTIQPPWLLDYRVTPVLSPISLNRHNFILL